MPSELENTDLGKPTLADHRVEGRLIFFRFLKWGSVGLVVFLIGGVIAFYQYENWAGRKAWRDTKAEYEAKGVSFDLQSYNPVMPPDDQNFAKSKVIRSLTEYTGDPRNPVYVDPKTRNEFLKMQFPYGVFSEVRRAGNHRFGVPVHLKEVILRSIESENSNPDASPENRSFSELVADISAFDSQIVSLAAAARKRPESQFSFEFSSDYEASLKTNVMGASAFMKTGEWLACRACFALDAGESEMASNCILLLFRFSELFKSFPDLFSDIVSNLFLELALRQIWNGVDKRAWSSEEIGSFREMIIQIDCVSSSVNAIEASAVLQSVYGTDFYLGDPKERNEALDGISFDEHELIESFAPFFPTGWWHRNRAVSVQSMWNEMIFPMRNGNVLDVIDMDITPHHQRLSVSEKFALSLLFPEVARVPERSVSIQAELDLILAACTIEQFLFKKGRLPVSDSEIRAAYPDGFRNDIYSPDMPLKFRKDPDNGRYCVYSVGRNGTDNGGISVPIRESEPFENVDVNKSDLVLRYSSSKILKAKAAYEAARKAKN